MKTLTYNSFIANLKSKTSNILIKLKSQNLIIEQLVILKMLNILKSSFFIYLIVFIKSTQKEDKMSNLINLFQNLVYEENRQKIETLVNFARQKETENETSESKRKNKKKRDKKKQKE